MEVQFLNLKAAYQELKVELDQLWYDVNRDSSYILGTRLESFEREFANYLGVNHVLGVANGLDGLALSLKVLDIGIQDEVIVPAHTYIASWLSVSEIGAIPVPVEVDRATYLIDTSKIKQAITNRTKGIIPVHLYGRVCDMAEILEIAKQYNLKIIEDAAQAHGSIDPSERKAGTFGDCASFSFYPGKNLGCFGDGGCITTDNDELAEKLRMLRNYGSKIRYKHEIIGQNSRLDELQAGVLSIKLKYLDAWNKRRQQIAKVYIRELGNVGDLVLPLYEEGNVWHIFPIRTSRREQLQDFLIANKLGINIHYPTPIHLQPAYRFMNYQQGAFPITEKVSREVLSLPIGPHLSENETMFCVEKIKEFFKIV